MGLSADTAAHAANKILTTLPLLNPLNAPQLKMEKVGFVQALYDPENRANASILPVDTGNGQVREVRIDYLRRGLESEVVDTPDCDPVPEIDRPAQAFKVELFAQNSVSVSEDTLEILTSADYAPENLAGMTTFTKFVKDLMTVISPLRTKMNKDLLTAANAYVGGYRNGVTGPKTYEFIRSDTYQPLYKGWDQFMADYNATGAQGRPIVVGAGVLETFVRGMNYGTANDGGIDFGLMNTSNPMKFYYDLFVDDIYGAPGEQNDFIAFAPGALQLATFNKYRGPRAWNAVWRDGSLRMTLPDPSIPGLNWDLRIFFDSCDEIYTAKVSLTYDLWANPTDGFQAGDPLEGVSYIWHKKAAIGDVIQKTEAVSP